MTQIKRFLKILDVSIVFNSIFFHSFSFKILACLQPHLNQQKKMCREDLRNFVLVLILACQRVNALKDNSSEAARFVPPPPPFAVSVHASVFLKNFTQILISLLE